MGTIKKFGEFINEWVSSSTIDNYNDNDNGINNTDQREKNWERKTLIKNIWQEIKRNHLDKYLDFPKYDNLYDVFVTMTVKADVDSRGIAYVNKNKVLVGSKIYFRCGTFAAASFCTAFSIE